MNDYINFFYALNLFFNEKKITIYRSRVSKLINRVRYILPDFWKRQKYYDISFPTFEIDKSCTIYRSRVLKLKYRVRFMYIFIWNWKIVYDLSFPTYEIEISCTIYRSRVLRMIYRSIFAWFHFSGTIYRDFLPLS